MLCHLEVGGLERHWFPLAAYVLCCVTSIERIVTTQRFRYICDLLNGTANPYVGMVSLEEAFLLSNPPVKHLGTLELSYM